MLAAFFNFVGLTFEALRLNPRGVDVALVFTGFYCLLIGYLMFRSTFVPRILGALMAFAGLGWLTYLSNPLVKYLSPYNLASALLAEASVFLWLVGMQQCCIPCGFGEITIRHRQASSVAKCAMCNGILAIPYFLGCGGWQVTMTVDELCLQ